MSYNAAATNDMPKQLLYEYKLALLLFRQPFYTKNIKNYTSGKHKAVYMSPMVGGWPTWNEHIGSRRQKYCNNYVLLVMELRIGFIPPFC